MFFIGSNNVVGLNASLPERRIRWISHIYVASPKSKTFWNQCRNKHNYKTISRTMKWAKIFIFKIHVSTTHTIFGTWKALNHKIKSIIQNSLKKPISVFISSLRRVNTPGVPSDFFSILFALSFELFLLWTHFKPNHQNDLFFRAYEDFKDKNFQTYPSLPYREKRWNMLNSIWIFSRFTITYPWPWLLRSRVELS